VVDQLRQFLNRPLRDGDRLRLFAIAVVVIAGTAAILALLDDADSPPHPSRAAATPLPSAPADPPATSPAPPATPRAPSEEGNLPAGSQPSSADIAQSKRAARQFLAGYLPYTYGRGRARRIAAVTPELRDRLTRERPRVPVGERRRRPRLELLQSDGVSRDRAELVALVGDGKRRYTVPLRLARSPSGWRVTDLGR
jgi:hypothetical protein